MRSNNACIRYFIDKYTLKTYTNLDSRDTKNGQSASAVKKLVIICCMCFN